MMDDFLQLKEKAEQDDRIKLLPWDPADPFANWTAGDNLIPSDTESK